MDFSGKSVLVTGGARGIGCAVAQSFARQGARLAIHYHSNATLAKETLEALHGDGHIMVQADITNPEEVQTAIENVTACLGGLDIVVNNAAVFIPHGLEDVEYNDWQQAWQDTLAVNLTGPANICYWASRFMMEHGGGRIVNISSRGAFRGEPGAPAYGASKAALNAMSQSLALRLAKHHIFVGVVAPGFVETERVAPRLTGDEGDHIRNQSPLGRVATTEEIAHAVLFMASEGAAFTTGAILDVNGASYLRT